MQLAILQNEVLGDNNQNKRTTEAVLGDYFSNVPADVSAGSAKNTELTPKSGATFNPAITVAEVLNGTTKAEEGPGGGGSSARAQITPALTGGATTYTAGDEVTFGGEQFYVVSDDGTTVSLLAKYCLSKTADEQLTASATLSDYARTFSSTNYWSEDFTSSPFDLQSSEMLTLLGQQSGETTANNAILKAQSYGTAKGVKGRLMYYSEADAIRNGSDSNMKNILWGKWSDGTQPTEGYLDWWLGAAYDTFYVWYVYGSNSILRCDDYYYTNAGVRPVLEIS